MARLRIKVEYKKVKKAIKDTQKRVWNLEPIFDDIGNDVVRFIHRNFQEGGRPKWPKWSAKYKKWRSENKPGKILILDKILYNSITHEAHRTYLLVGSNMEYAATHNFGDQRRNIPQREFLNIQNDEHEFITSEIEDYLRQPWQ